jgi:hypothetical protein
MFMNERDSAFQRGLKNLLNLHLPIGGADSGYQSHFNYNPANIQTAGSYRPYNPFVGCREADQEDGWTSSSTDSGSDGLPSELVPNIRREVRTGGRVRRTKIKRIDGFGGMAIQGGQILYNSKTDFRRWCGLFTHMRLTNKMTELANKSSFSDSNSVLTRQFIQVLIEDIFSG